MDSITYWNIGIFIKCAVIIAISGRPASAKTLTMQQNLNLLGFKLELIVVADHKKRRETV